MKLYLHIGTEKTGTTTIQETLYVNREILRSRGFHVLQCGGSKNSKALVACCLKDDHYNAYCSLNGIDSLEKKRMFQRALKIMLDNELKHLPPTVHSVIISSEFFHSGFLAKEEVENAYMLFAEYFSEITVICYLREQSLLAASSYGTNIRNGACNTLTEKLGETCIVTNNYYNYYVFLSMWKNVFGKENLTVRLFDTKKFVNNDLIDDFFTAISHDIVPYIVKISLRHNESLTRMGQFLGRAVNKAFPRFDKHGHEHPLRNKIFSIINKEFVGKGEQASLSEYNRIYNAFQESNALLAKEFFNIHEGESLFPYAPVSDAEQLCALSENDKENFEKILLLISLEEPQIPDFYVNPYKDITVNIEKEDIATSLRLLHFTQKLRTQDEYETVISRMNDTIDAHGDWSEPHIFLSYIYDEKGDLDKAIACARRATEVEKHNFEHKVRLIQLLCKNKEYITAEEYIIALQKEFPQWSESYIQLSHVYDAQGKLNEAVQSARKALVMNHSFLGHWQHYMRLLFKKKAYQEMRKAFCQAVNYNKMWEKDLYPLLVMACRHSSG